MRHDAMFDPKIPRTVYASTARPGLSVSSKLGLEDLAAYWREETDGSPAEWIGSDGSRGTLRVHGAGVLIEGGSYR